MKIACLEIANFRKLKLVRIDLRPDTTVLVGANNSGKTTAMDALRQFLVGQPFALTDFTISDVPAIRKIGAEWEAREAEATAGDARTPSDDLAQWTPLLPTLDLWIESAEADLYMASQLLPLLDEYSGAVGLRLRLQPRDIEALRRTYLRVKTEADRTLESDVLAEGELKAKLWPVDLADYLESELSSSFELKLYKLDPARISPSLALTDFDAVGVIHGQHELQAIDPDEEPLAMSVLKRLVRVDFVNAQRGLGADGASSRLSEQVAEFYERHLDPGKRPGTEDLVAIRTTQQAAFTFDTRLESLFKDSLDEIASMGYPGSSNPSVVIRTKLQLADGLRHDSVLRYRLASESEIPLELPEGMNGLGYQNLVLMIFSLISFRKSRMKPDRNAPVNDQAEEIRPLHLVLIEEPEAHLHAQVQQVFIKRAYSTLTKGAPNPGLSTQLVVSTHSSHIAHEINFENIRYFRRIPATEGVVPLSVVENLTNTFGEDDETERFVKRYVRLNHCNVLFADALIVVEGAAETLLVPEFVRASFDRIAQTYVEYLEIGGAHAHRLRPLLDVLQIPTLVITDIDARDANGKVRPTLGAGHVTTNSTILSWLAAPAGIDDLVNLGDDEKILKVAGLEMTRFAYQTSVLVELNDSQEHIIPSTFEDALVLSNTETFSGMSGTGLVKKFADALNAAEATPRSVATQIFDDLKTGSKAEFALEVLMQQTDLSAIQPPTYIQDGLAWLESRVSTLDLVGHPLQALQPEEVEVVL